jgi:hypothetical protein
MKEARPMPKVHFVKSARKDNPVAKKGESYFWWKFRYGGKRFSKTRPRGSQLTQSAYFGTVRAIGEQIEDTTVETNDDLIALRDEVVSQLQDLRDETQSSLDNMPDQLQYSPTGEMLQERIDALESAETDIENIDEYHDDEPVRGDFDDLAEGDEEFQEAIDEFEEGLQDHLETAKSEMIDYVYQCEV